MSNYPKILAICNSGKGSCHNRDLIYGDFRSDGACFYCELFKHELTKEGEDIFFEDPELMHEAGIAIKRGKLKVNGKVKGFVDKHYFWEGF